MSEGVVIALIGLAASGGVGAAFLGWLRFRKKDKVEVEAQRQVALGELFDNANDLQQYVQAQVKSAVAEAIAPLQKELEDLKKASHRIHDAFRSFFTQLWVWDRGGRVGQMPVVPSDILTELRLGHFLDLPFEDTEPTRRKETTHE
ncbi:membrane protein [Microbacterium phage DoTi]|nr:membrane protein [Microbacterium phage DoTi]